MPAAVNMCYVVLLDTSGSMRQVASHGITLMDSAKSFIENLLTSLQSSNPRVDMVALFTGAGADAPLAMDAPPYTALRQALKRVTARDMVDVAALLRRGFEFLHTMKHAHEGELYQGYNIAHPAPCGHVILVTDGIPGSTLASGMSSFQAVTDIRLRCAGAELYRQPFRCEHRLWCVLLQIPGTTSSGGGAVCSVGPSEHPLAALAAETGGACKAVQSLQSYAPAVDFFASNCVPGVSVRVAAAELDSKGHLRVDAASVLLTHVSLSHAGPGWLLPDNLHGDSEEGALPLRHAHPLIAYVPAPVDVDAPPGFADTYEVTQGPVSSRIAEAAAAKGADICWQVYADAGKGLGWLPLGYLRAQPGGVASVTLTVLSFNHSRVAPAFAAAVNSRVAGSSAVVHAQLSAAFQELPRLHAQTLHGLLLKRGLPHHVLPAVPPQAVPPRVQRVLGTARVDAKALWAGWTRDCNLQTAAAHYGAASELLRASVPSHGDQAADVFAPSLPALQRMQPAQVIQEAAVAAAQVLALNCASQGRKSRMTPLLALLQRERRTRAHSIPVERMSDFESRSAGEAPLRVSEDDGRRTSAFGTPFRPHRARAHAQHLLGGDGAGDGRRGSLTGGLDLSDGDASSREQEGGAGLDVLDDSPSAGLLRLSDWKRQALRNGTSLGRKQAGATAAKERGRQHAGGQQPPAGPTTAGQLAQLAALDTHPSMIANGFGPRAFGPLTPQPSPRRDLVAGVRGRLMKASRTQPPAEAARPGNDRSPTAAAPVAPVPDVKPLHGGSPPPARHQGQPPIRPDGPRDPRAGLGGAAPPSTPASGGPSRVRPTSPDAAESGGPSRHAARVHGFEAGGRLAPTAAGSARRGPIVPSEAARANDASQRNSPVAAPPQPLAREASAFSPRQPPASSARSLAQSLLDAPLKDGAGAAQSLPPEEETQHASQAVARQRAQGAAGPDAQAPQQRPAKRPRDEVAADAAADAVKKSAHVRAADDRTHAPAPLAVGQPLAVAAAGVAAAAHAPKADGETEADASLDELWGAALTETVDVEARHSAAPERSGRPSGAGNRGPLSEDASMAEEGDGRAEDAGGESIDDLWGAMVDHESDLRERQGGSSAEAAAGGGRADAAPPDAAHGRERSSREGAAGVEGEPPGRGPRPARGPQASGSSVSSENDDEDSGLDALWQASLGDDASAALQEGAANGQHGMEAGPSGSGGRVAVPSSDSRGPRALDDATSSSEDDLEALTEQSRRLASSTHSQHNSPAGSSDEKDDSGDDRDSPRASLRPGRKRAQPARRPRRTTTSQRSRGRGRRTRASSSTSEDAESEDDASEDEEPRARPTARGRARGRRADAPGDRGGGRGPGGVNGSRGRAAAADGRAARARSASGVVATDRGLAHSGSEGEGSGDDATPERGGAARRSSIRREDAAMSGELSSEDDDDDGNDDEKEDDDFDDGEFRGTDDHAGPSRRVGRSRDAAEEQGVDGHRARREAAKRADLFIKADAAI